MCWHHSLAPDRCWHWWAVCPHWVAGGLHRLCACRVADPTNGYSRLMLTDCKVPLNINMWCSTNRQAVRLNGSKATTGRVRRWPSNQAQCWPCATTICDCLHDIGVWQEWWFPSSRCGQREARDAVIWATWQWLPTWLPKPGCMRYNCCPSTTPPRATPGATVTPTAPSASTRSIPCMPT